MLGNIWDLCPYDHAFLIAQIIEVLIMLIMCQTNSVGSDLLDQFHIALVLFFWNGIANAFEILMTGNPMEWIRLTIQIKSLIRIYGKGTHAKALGDLIYGFPMKKQACLSDI